MANAEEIAFWNADAGSRWARLQAQIDRTFVPISIRALAAASPQQGERVLDIGCGCGTTTFELGTLVGASGSVLGVDVSEPMLAVAEARASDLAIHNVQFIRADAASEAFEGAAFDLAFSRFGVMFFDEPRGAFANIRKALREDARAAFVCWRDLAANPWFSVPIEAVRPFVPPQPKPDPRAPGPLAFADAEYVRGILENAGFADASFTAFDAHLSLGSHAEAFEMLSQIGPAMRLLDGSEAGARAEALASLDAALAKNERDGEVLLGGGVWIVTARCVVA